MMIIGIDARNLNNKTSGLVTYVFNLVRVLAQNNKYKLVLFINEKKINELKHLLPNKVHIVPVYYDNSFLSARNTLYEEMVFGSIINKQNISILHCPTGLGVPRNVKVPIVSTIHDCIALDAEDGLSFLQKTLFKMNIRNTLARSKKIIAISKYTKERIRFHSPNYIHEINVIYDGADEPEYINDDELIDNHIDGKYIMYVGSATKRKNIPQLVEGYAQYIKESHSNCKLLIISKFDRKATQATEALIRNLCIMHKIEHLIVLPRGFVNNEKKFYLMKNCLFFIYPSYEEGFGLPIIEAMKVGKAVACSSIPPFHEIAEDSCLYFNPHDPVSIKNAITTLVHDPEKRHHLERKGIKRASLFTWEKMTLQYEAIYKTLINMNP